MHVYWEFIIGGAMCVGCGGGDKSREILNMNKRISIQINRLNNDLLSEESKSIFFK